MMVIGIPKEIKNHEYRVGLLPGHVEELRADGHRVIVQRGAGKGSGATDQDYIRAGAQIAPTAAAVWARADFIVKVKEPLPSEYRRMRKGQLLMAFFHFAADASLLRAVQRSGCHAVAYELIRSGGGSLPCLTPMSEIAGRMAVHEGAKCLEEPHHGRGLLLAGVPGVVPAKVVILGGGVVGMNAAKMAAGLGADVRLLDISLDRLRYLDDILPANVTLLMSDAQNIREQAAEADLLIGAVLIPGARTPVLVSEALVKKMKPGAVIVDVGIDQGGCVATVRPTTHDAPTFVRHGVVHYCVTNMPGAVARTSTQALTNATFPFVRDLAARGTRAFDEPGPLRSGLAVSAGKLL
ncbi:alanine dehydrogenase [Oscillatoria laete-virens NRMC-F 0139]|nr:alanine dehydrogenase [Oscillatoria laete-virens]MDL5053663.1 alanine dehydrogenase [Oscillatoria laete-virens NRMC-F 0139]